MAEVVETIPDVPGWYAVQETIGDTEDKKIVELINIEDSGGGYGYWRSKNYIAGDYVLELGVHSLLSPIQVFGSPTTGNFCRPTLRFAKIEFPVL